jgi:aryl-alcohol dehydrogenase-like predicted oxidoreductase
MLQKQSELGVTIVPILGITKVEHLEDNLVALDVKLGTYEIERMEEIAGRARLGPRSY